MKDTYNLAVGNWLWMFNARHYLAEILVLITFFGALRFFRSSFTIMLRAIKQSISSDSITLASTRAPTYWPVLLSLECILVWPVG